MTNLDTTPELFPVDDDKQPIASGNVFEYPNRDFGVIPYQGLRDMVREGELISRFQDIPILPDQIQPASIDLRLGRRAWRVRASFLPGAATVIERVRHLDDLPEIDLSKGAVFEKGIV